MKRYIFLTFLAIAILSAVLAYPANSNNIPQKYIYYTVKSNDNLWNLSLEYMPDIDPRRGITLIRNANGMPDTYIIHPGDILNIPSPFGTYDEPLGQE